MADKPHPSRPSHGIASTKEGEPQPARSQSVVDAFNTPAEPTPAPEKPKRTTTFAQAIARIERVMGEVKPGFHAAVRAWFTEAYPPQEAK